MSRTPPTLIVSHAQGDRVVEICEADAVYAVLYQGKPIKVRTHTPAVRYMGYKYTKTMFPEAGHAVRLANRLNLAHSTDQFTVGILTQARTLNQANSPE